MASADAMISKAGGLSSTEAAVAGVPMVNLLVYSACEEKNVHFFETHGMSLRAGNAQEAVNMAVELMKDKERAEEMCAKQRRYVNPHAARDIVEEMMKDDYDQ